MIEKSELNYRKIIELELESLELDDDTKKKLLAESDDILKLAVESKDKFEFLSEIVRRQPKPTPMLDFKYGHVMTFLSKRYHVSRNSVIQDFRKRVTDGMMEPPESHHKTNGFMMAIKASALNGKPVFTVRDIVTGMAANAKQAETWVGEQVSLGSDFVFIRSESGWRLLGADSGLPFSEDQIVSFFSNDLLDGLLKSHIPYLSEERHAYNQLKRSGLN